MSPKRRSLDSEEGCLFISEILDLEDFDFFDFFEPLDLMLLLWELYS